MCADACTFLILISVSSTKNDLTHRIKPPFVFPEFTLGIRPISTVNRILKVISVSVCKAEISVETNGGMMKMFPECQGGTYMKAWNHLNFEQRKIIVHLLAKRSKLCVIADTLEVDPSAVSKEIKRNRVLVKPGRVADQGCKHLGRFPYCCNGCVKKYQGCLHNHYTYDAQKAHGLAQRRLVDTRSGIDRKSVV